MTAEVFSEYVRKYADTLYRVAFNCCGNAADAEDMMQTALIKLYRDKTDFQTQEHVKRWLIRVTINESRKLRRSAWFRRRVSLEEYAGTIDFEAPEESELFLAVMSLPEKYRVPLYLYYYEDYPVKEVAALCGIPPSTVQTRLQRARQKLKDILTSEEDSQWNRNTSGRFPG